ncbi:hypothetical protein J6590_018240 [Homalodisca vitripennis]|nr:hypothetical protein J6590_018240 [Homalodisca vitripennis]
MLRFAQNVRTQRETLPEYSTNPPVREMGLSHREPVCRCGEYHYNRWYFVELVSQAIEAMSSSCLSLTYCADASINNSVCKLLVMTNCMRCSWYFVELVSQAIEAMSSSCLSLTYCTDASINNSYFVELVSQAIEAMSSSCQSLTYCTDASINNSYFVELVSQAIEAMSSSCQSLTYCTDASINNSYFVELVSQAIEAMSSPCLSLTYCTDASINNSVRKLLVMTKCMRCSWYFVELVSQAIEAMSSSCLSLTYCTDASINNSLVLCRTGESGNRSDVIGVHQRTPFPELETSWELQDQGTTITDTSPLGMEFRLTYCRITTLPYFVIEQNKYFLAA